MKCLILAAGYATRLYPLTENFPKPLLKVKDKTIIDWIIGDLNSLNTIDEFFIITNHKFYKHFVSWNKYPNLKIIDDGTLTNDTRLGAVKDIDLVLQKENINDDLLIVAGDNLLDFSLNKYLNYHKEKNTSCVLRFYQKDINILKKNGVASIDENEVITSMEEKPNKPKSNWIIPPFYIIKKDDLSYISKAINDDVNVDAPGSFIAYLSSHTTVHAYLMEGHRYDIGTLDSYQEICETYNGIKI